jgi:hypothetical protein
MDHNEVSNASEVAAPCSSHCSSSELEQWADVVWDGLRKFIEQRGRSVGCDDKYAPDENGISLFEYISAAMSFIRSVQPNLADVDRLNAMDDISTRGWIVLIGGKIAGRGCIRQAIDQAVASQSK